MHGPYPYVYLGGPSTGKTDGLLRVCLDLTPRRPPLFLTFYEMHAQNVARYAQHVADRRDIQIVTMQRFVFDLLGAFFRETGLAKDAKPISAPARSLVVRAAWKTVAGPLWARYHDAPGAVEETTRIFDWLSAHRTRFDLDSDELSDDELARIYAAYIDTCRREKLLTFQEAGLRVLSLLENPDVLNRIMLRFPVIVVDDLHYARPDQLAFVERLHAAGAIFAVSAWCHDHHADPGLRRVWETLQRLDGTVAHLDGPSSFVEPGIYTGILRVMDTDRLPQEHRHGTHTLLTAETVEAETSAVVRSISTQLGSDPSLLPEDITVICTDVGHVGFLQRRLENAGIPFAASVAARRNPFITAGLLLVAWHTRGRRFETLDRLIRLPLAGLDPLDIRRLEKTSREMETSLLELSEADYPETLRFPDETAAVIRTLRDLLTRTEEKKLSAQWIETSVARLAQVGRMSADPDFLETQKTIFEVWVGHIQDMETTGVAVRLPANETLAFVERLCDLGETETPCSGVRIVDGNTVEGVLTRVCYVTGLSENTSPRVERPFQIVEESALPALFADGRSVALPACRDRQAWIEREMRRLVTWLSRGTECLTLSVSRHSAVGQLQLPSPFFERLLGADGEIDRHGRLRVDREILWRLDHATDPENGSSEPSAPDPPVTDTGERVVHAAVYSASQVRTYLRCPLQFYYDRVLHVDSDEAPGPMRRGSLFHTILCAGLGNGQTTEVDLRAVPRFSWLDDGDLLVRRVLTALEAAWEGATVELPGGGTFVADEPWAGYFGPALQRKATRRSVERVARLWAEYETLIRPDRAQRRPILLETSFRFYVDDYRLTGRIDRIDEVSNDKGVFYDVIDYKTGSAGADSVAVQIGKFLPENRETPVSDYQLPIYAMALKSGVSDINAFPRTLTYINLDRLGKTNRGTFTAESVRSVTLTKPGEVDYKKGTVPTAVLEGRIREELTTILSTLTVSPYLATPGFHCRFCGFRTACSRGINVDL
ncbi:MAG: PD-(D/E)XK nuclease family protein [candidate division Zixibacteria bacterium]|nr:PD-(D/E)XK nuclease family protein [candidate division Zixibacteria bacterium]